MCRDGGVCRAVDAALGAVGLGVEHAPEIPGDAADVALFIVDLARRRANRSVRPARRS